MFARELGCAAVRCCLCAAACVLPAWSSAADGRQPFRPAEAFQRAFIEARHPAGQLVSRWRDVRADLHVPSPPLPRYHFHPAPASQLFNPPEAVRQTVVELPVNLDCQGGGRPAGIDGVGVDGCLDGEVGCRFELEIAPPRLGREVGMECALDIDRACVMSLDDSSDYPPDSW